LEPSDDIGQRISFSYTTYSYSHPFEESPQPSELKPAEETIPVSAFSHHASAMQAIARYLVDVRGKSFTEAARIVGRKPKSLWSSYHQTTPLPKLEESVNIPLHIFSSSKAPLEALVLHLKSLGLRNVEIARMLKLDPKTTWTVAKRGEAKP
jgi:hypothetical protein